jgi:hypothetical protein
LAKARRCAWLEDELGGKDEAPARLVWARGKTVAFRCPKSIATAQSLNFVEQFLYWRGCGGDLWSLDAKSADAILLLQEEVEKEKKNEEK